MKIGPTLMSLSIFLRTIYYDFPICTCILKYAAHSCFLHNTWLQKLNTYKFQVLTIFLEFDKYKYDKWQKIYRPDESVCLKKNKLWMDFPK